MTQVEGNPNGEDFGTHRRGEKYVPDQRRDGRRLGFSADDTRLIHDLQQREKKFVDEIRPRPTPGNRTLVSIRDAMLGDQEKAQRIAQDLDEIESGRKTVTIEEFAALHAVRLGSLLTTSDANRKRHQLIDKIGVSSDVKSYFDLLEFAASSGPEFKIGDISLWDIVKPDKQHPPSLSSVMRYCFESVLMHYRNRDQNYLEDTDSPLAREYLGVATKNLRKLAFSFLFTFNPLDNKTVSSVSGKYPEYAAYTKTLLKQMEHFHEGFQDALFDPASSEFPAIQQLLDNYLNLDKGISFIAVHFIAQGGASLQNIYRRAKDLETHPQYGDFYKKFTDLIVEYTERVQGVTEVLLYPDLETIFSPQHSEEGATPLALNGFAKIIHNIVAKSGKKEYKIEPNDVTWGDIIPPHSVTLTFDKARPSKFSVKLYYTSKEEDLNLSIGIDTKKGEFTWNFLEAPGDERMSDFYAGLLISVQSMLQDVDKQATKDKEERIQGRNRIVHVEPQRVGGRVTERPAPEVDEISKKRRNKQWAGEEAYEDLFADPAAPDRARPQINFDDTLRSLIPTGTDWEQVKSRLEEFNETGAGFIKPLVKDRELFSFRVGKLRVLLREEPSQEQGRRVFKIVKVGNRGEIYRKL